MSPDNNQASTEVSRLERILLYGLRASDPFCKMDMGQFIVLLNGASEENSHKVVERINKNFHTTYPRSKAKLAFKIYPLKQKKNEPRV
jgi:GGDEF domain-containing protein